MASRKRTLLHLWLLELAADFFAVTVSYFAVYFFRFHSALGVSFFTAVNQTLGIRDTGALTEIYADFYLASSFRIVFLITAAVCFLYAMLDMYSDYRPLRKRLTAWKTVQANAMALALFYLYFYLSRNTFHPRSFFVTIMPLNAAVTIVLRQILYTALAAARRKTGIDIVDTVVLGDGEDAQFIVQLAKEYSPYGINVIASMPLDLSTPFEATLKDIDLLISRNNAHMLVTADRRLSVTQIMCILEMCAEHKMPCKILSEEFSVIVNQARVRSDLIKGVPLMHFAAPHESGLQDAIARAGDILLSLTLIILLSPLIALASLLIKFTSKGPVLFRQERIGVNRKPFVMLKFRTMHHRADEMLAAIEEFNESGRGLFKIRKDPRMTAVGKFLRRFSIDELPQLFNVLKGDMSIVGPRPLPRRDFEGYYENWHYSRHEGLPGITCLWQVSGRSDLDFHNMCILDVYYLRNRGWVLNLKILFRTIHAVLFARGAY